jgi:hypothetical protein
MDSPSCAPLLRPRCFADAARWPDAGARGRMCESRASGKRQWYQGIEQIRRAGSHCIRQELPGRIFRSRVTTAPLNRLLTVAGLNSGARNRSDGEGWHGRERG